MGIEIRKSTAHDVPGVVELQRHAFPPPFSTDLHWDEEHLLLHLEIYPEAQWVAIADGVVVGSCSNTRIAEADWAAHENWYVTVGGPRLDAFDSTGSTLYGLDIAVHPGYRKQGIGRRFYEARYDLVRSEGMVRYGTGCRMPDFSAFKRLNPSTTPAEYALRVANGEMVDRTLTPLLKFGLRFLSVKENYMQDEESANAGALLEWNP
jgi:ribosomal protein S18 acetylase RimI-like enzyme